MYTLISLSKTMDDEVPCPSSQDIQLSISNYGDIEFNDSLLHINSPLFLSDVWTEDI